MDALEKLDSLEKEFHSQEHKMEWRESKKIGIWIEWLRNTCTKGYTVLVPEKLNYLTKYLFYIEFYDED